MLRSLQLSRRETINTLNAKTEIYTKCYKGTDGKASHFRVRVRKDFHRRMNYLKP